MAVETAQRFVVGRRRHDRRPHTVTDRASAQTVAYCARPASAREIARYLNAHMHHAPAGYVLGIVATTFGGALTVP